MSARRTADSSQGVAVADGRYLRAHLGKPVAAFVTHGAPELAAERLHAACEAAQVLSDAYGDESARGWFFGRNDGLDDQAPATVLRESQDRRQLALIPTLARAFVGAP